MAYTTINKGSSYFNTVLYTGNGASNSVTGVGFQPDFVWLKSRSNAYYHGLFDAVRTAGYKLYTNLTDAEDFNSGYLTSFNSNGFSLGSDGGINGSGATFASWNWLANNTSGSSNTAGTITSTVAANTTSGFSIVKYTGNGSSSATVGHGLGVTPAMIIIKNRSAASQWMVKHKSLATDYNLQLNVTDAQVYLPSGTGQGGVGNLSSSSTFGFTSGTTGVNNVNNSGSNFIAYCFAEVKGYSKFGSYTGNNSTDGTFVYTGFKPAFVMIKTTSAAEAWNIGDNKRNITYPAGANVNNAELYANSSSAETNRSTRGGGITQFDMLSNGFKCRGANPDINYTGYNYIYMAFAENPFVSSTLIPTTAV